VVLLSLLVGAQAKVNDFVTGCRRALGAASLLWVSRSRSLVLVQAAWKVEEPGAVVKLALLLQLVE